MAWYDVVNSITKTLIKVLRLLSFPWAFPSKYCKSDGKTMKNLVLRMLLYSGVLLNTILLFSLLHYFKVTPKGMAFGLHTWEWTLLGIGVGRIASGVIFLALEFFGIERRQFTITFASIFGASAHAGDLRERNAVRLALTLLSGQAAYFLAAYIVQPSNQLFCGECEEWPSKLQNTAGLCCHIVQVGKFTPAFFSAIGANLATGYAFTRMFLSGAVSAHHAHLNIQLLHTESEAQHEADRARTMWRLPFGRKRCSRMCRRTIDLFAD